MGIIGIVTVRRHPAGTVDALRQLHAEGRHGEADQLLHMGEVVTQSRNKVVDSANCGIDLLRQWFISGVTGSPSYPVGPQWGEIGTGTTTPAITDTALTTSVARAYISNATNNGSGASAALQFFFSDANLANGTYHEFGTFVQGTSTIGSGKMVNHVLFTTAYTKVTGNDTTCEVDFTIANL